MGKTLPMLYASMLMDKGPGLLIPPTTTIGNINIIFIPCILCIYVLVTFESSIKHSFLFLLLCRRMNNIKKKFND